MKTYKFKIPKVSYPCMMADALSGIKLLLGEFDIVKVKELVLSTDMIITVKKREKNEQGITD